MSIIVIINKLILVDHQILPYRGKIVEVGAVEVHDGAIVLQVVADAQVLLVVVLQQVFGGFPGQALFHVALHSDAPFKLLIFFIFVFLICILFDTANDEVDALFHSITIPIIKLPVDEELDVEDTTCIGDSIVPPAAKHQHSQLDQILK